MIPRRRRSKLQPKWLEISSIGSTIAVTVGGFLAVAAFERRAAEEFSALRIDVAAPARFVIDLTNRPFLIGGLVLLVPTLLAFLGASANGRGRKLTGPALLVLAPLVASLGLCLCLTALALPLLSIVPARALEPSPSAPNLGRAVRAESGEAPTEEFVCQPSSCHIAPWRFPEPPDSLLHGHGGVALENYGETQPPVSGRPPPAPLTAPPPAPQADPNDFLLHEGNNYRHDSDGQSDPAAFEHYLRGYTLKDSDPSAARAQFERVLKTAGEDEVLRKRAQRQLDSLDDAL